MDSLPLAEGARLAAASTGTAEVCIIGAGVSGLAAAKALKDQGIAFDGFELGSDLGGMWRYENDSGTSSAYRSLHIDSSRQSLAWPDHQLADSLPDYPSHAQMLAHFEAYAQKFDLYPQFRFRTRVARVEPAAEGLWDVHLQSLENPEKAQEVRRYRQVIVANGHLSDPKYPDCPGSSSGTRLHCPHYRVPDPSDGTSARVG